MKINRGELKVSACPIGACPIGGTPLRGKCFDESLGDAHLRHEYLGHKLCLIISSYLVKPFDLAQDRLRSVSRFWSLVARDP